jgi:hypothetical protein
MIQELPDGKLMLTFEDWSEEMSALGNRLFQLPLPRGAATIRTHELGIDRLSKLLYGKMAIRELFHNVDELTYCPDHKEVVKLGKAIIRMVIDVDTLLDRRALKRMHLQDRAKSKRPAR